LLENVNENAIEELTRLQIGVYVTKGLVFNVVESVCKPAHVVQCVRHSDAMCSRA